MTWTVICIAVVVGLSFVVWAITRRRRAHLMKLRYEVAARLFQKAPTDGRSDALLPLLSRGEVDAAAWYFQGCQHLREERPREAARAFGASHHADCNIETAALLTFAALKAGAGESNDVIEQIVITWEEMKRFDVLARDEDRFLIESLIPTTRKAPNLSALGQLVWAVVSPSQQAQLEKLVETRPNWAVPLFAGH